MHLDELSAEEELDQLPHSERVTRAPCRPQSDQAIACAAWPRCPAGLVRNDDQKARVSVLPFPAAAPLPSVATPAGVVLRRREPRGVLGTSLHALAPGELWQLRPPGVPCWDCSCDASKPVKASGYSTRPS